MIPISETFDDSLDDVFLPPATTTAKTVNKFQPKPRAKTKKPVTASSNQSDDQCEKLVKPDVVAECTDPVVVSIPESSSAPDVCSSESVVDTEVPHGKSDVSKSNVSFQTKAVAEVSTELSMEDDPLFHRSAIIAERAVGKFRPNQHSKTTKSAPASSSSDDTMQHVSTAGGAEDNGALNLSSSSFAPTGFSSQVNETQEPLNAMPVLSGIESYDDIFVQLSDTSVKQVGKFQPKSALHLKKSKPKSVSFILPDAAETAAAPVDPESVSQPKEKNAKSVSLSLPDATEAAASPVGAHSKVLADNLTGAEPLLQMMNGEFVEKIPHTTSMISDNVDIRLDHRSTRNEDLADFSHLESFNSILSEPTSVTGWTLRAAKTNTGKSNSISRTDVDKESTSSQWDSLPMDTELSEDPNLCIPADSLTNLANDQAEPFETSSLEAKSPGGNEILETISSTLDRDKYIGGKRKLSAVSEDTGNEVQSSTVEEQTQQILDDQSTSKAFEEHGAGKSSRKLRKRISVDSPSGELDGRSTENWDVENSNNSQMDEDNNDDEYRGEDMPKQRKQPKRSKRHMTDAQKPSKRRRKTSKEPDSTKIEPPKKRFPHGTRRKRRQVDKVLLETPEYEIDRRQIALRQLIMLGEAKERIASKEAAASGNNQSNIGSFSSGTHIDLDNPYDEDVDHDEQHRNMLRNSRKVNYQTHMPKPQRGKWSKSETELFYEAIRQFGTDFGMIEKLFPNRTRHQVKLKFKMEERKHPSELRDAMIHRSEDLSHFERVIQQLQAEADEESRQDDPNNDPTIVSQDAANENEEERDQPEKTEQKANGFDGEATNSEKHNKWDGDGTSDYNEYEGFEWDASASSPQNEEKFSEYDEFY